MTKEQIFDFIKQHHIAVISTVNSSALPEASVVGFGIDQNFEIYVATYDSSRKFANIKKNPRVAMVIGWEHGKTVQIEGEAEHITDSEKINEISMGVLEKMPTIAKYVKPERVVFLKITPKWLKYSDISGEPWVREELKFI